MIARLCVLLGWLSIGCVGQPTPLAKTRDLDPHASETIFNRYDVKAIDSRTGVILWHQKLDDVRRFPILEIVDDVLLVKDQDPEKERLCLEPKTGAKVDQVRCDGISSPSTQEDGDSPDRWLPSPPAYPYASGPFEVRIERTRTVELDVAPTALWFVRGAAIVTGGDRMRTSIGELHAFDRSTGRRLWKRRSAGPGRVAVSHVGDGLAALIPGGTILFIDSTGTVTLEVKRPILQPAPRYWGASQFVPVGKSLVLVLYERLVGLDPKTATFLWSTPRNSTIGGPVVSDELMFFATPRPRTSDHPGPGPTSDNAGAGAAPPTSVPVGHPPDDLESPPSTQIDSEP